jgi:transketolase
MRQRIESRAGIQFWESLAAMAQLSRIDTGGEAYRSLVRRARLRLLEMHYAAGVGHIGGNLSALDAMLALHHRVMGSDDVFILSKGHAAGALYITLWTLGLLSDAQLAEFHGEGTRLPGHPAPSGVPGIPLATGSLGHGFPMAAGISLAKRFSDQPGRVFCLTSDGEWEEGSTWEALIFARHQALENLTVLIDANGLQGFGSTTDVASLNSDSLGDRISAFGVPVEAVDGHDADAIIASLERKLPGPRFVVLHTVKGKGVSFMEGRMEWHYLPLTEELYARAVRELEAR